MLYRLLCCWSVCCLLFALTPAWSRKPPNIVLIISDDHAWQAIGAYGGAFGASQHIDRLAAEGVTFRQATVVNSLCGPSRAALLTGKYSHKNGFIDNHSSFNGDQDSFIKQLQKAGYLTAWIGKWHLVSRPQGFDYWKILPGQGFYYNPVFINMDGSRETVPGYCTNIITDVSEQWLKGRDTSRPFCLIIGHKATHRNWMPDTADLRAFSNVQFPLPSNFYDRYKGRYAAAHQDMSIEKTMRLGYDLKMLPDTGFGKDQYIVMNPAQRAAYQRYYEPLRNELTRLQLKDRALTEWKYQRYMQDYMATALSLDRNIGRTMDYLDAHGLRDNTIFIYTSDQGFYLGEHGWFDKRFMYEESLRTPFMMRYPPLLKAGTVLEQPVMNIDIGPTLLQAAGLPVPADMQGLGCWPMLTQGAPLNRDAVYYHYYEFAEHSVRPHFGIRTSRYKLIRFYGDHDAWELYDLQEDPKEMKNLAGKKRYQQLFTGMLEKLKAEALRYDDPKAMALLQLR